MREDEAIRFLAKAGRFGELGLGRIVELLGHLGEPQKGMRFYHVAGTNGKGSTVAAIDSCLRAMGRRTGRYISPHLARPHERVTVDAQEISPEELAQATSRVADAAAALADPPTEFELWTAVALLHMQACGVTDVAWETGLGGRFDATNIVAPEVSVITSIGLDHVDRLGGTLEAIAAEKAGIIKPGRPLVLGRLDAGPRAVVRAQARAHGSTVWEIGREIEVADIEVLRSGTRFRYSDPLGDLGRLEFGLLGEHQAENAALALAALRRSGQGGDMPALIRGLRKTDWPARFEILPGDVEVVLDGAHNPPGFEALARTFRSIYGDVRPVALFGCLRDRDARAMTEPLQEIVASWHTAKPPGTDRALAAEEAAHALGGRAHESPVDALDAAIEQAGLFGVPVLCCGSLYLVGHLRALLAARGRVPTV